MDFYTNVVQWGNFLLVRGVDNNQRVNFRLKYKPTLFVPVMKQTDWKTLDGKSVTPYQFDCIKDAKDFLLKYESHFSSCSRTKQIRIHIYFRYISTKGKLEH